MKKTYTIAGITGVIAVLLISGYITWYNRDYLDVLADNPKENSFVMDFNSKERIEVLTRTTNCPYGLFRIDGDSFKIRCGNQVVGEYSSWTEYWKTYGTNQAGETAWWERNNRKSSLTKLDYKIVDNYLTVIRTTSFYKGKTGSDGVLTEEFLIYLDSLKITSKYDTENGNVKHRLIYREDFGSDNILFDTYDPSGNFVVTTKNNLGKRLFVFGEKTGDLFIDPSVTIVAPADKGATANVTGDSLTFTYNCTGPTVLNRIMNSTLYMIWNSTLGWNASILNTTAATNSQYNGAVTWTLPNYVDMWPYAWKVECCSNESIRDYCKTSSARLIAVNIRPSLTGVPTITAGRADETISCTLDGSYITAHSRRGRFSYDSEKTNGVVNITWRVYNDTNFANFTFVQNTPNLTVTFLRDSRTFNVSYGWNISCSALVTDGVQNATLWGNSSKVMITNGQPWGLNITYPDGDYNALNGTEASKTFTINWSRISTIGTEGDTYHYSGALQTTVGINRYELFNYTILNLTNGNASSYDPVNKKVFNTSNYAQGNYYINVTVCEGNFSRSPGATNCISDVTDNTLDLFDYRVAFGPEVISVRFPLPGAGSTAKGLQAVGQTNSLGIFKVTSTALGAVNLTITLNNTLNSCLTMWCAPSNLKSTIYDNLTRANDQGWNMTNFSQGKVNTTLPYFHQLTNYIWCWADSTACATGIIQNYLFNFNVNPKTF